VLQTPATLDAPVFRLGEVVGVVRHEQAGELREWTSRDRHFVAAVADLVAVLLEQATRLDVEAALRAQRERLVKAERMAALSRMSAGVARAFHHVLPLKQSQLTMRGHAVEARICAENPDGGFLPATGTLDVARWPAHVAFERGEVRIDAGVREGDAISPYYDSMIAKLIVWGEDRAQALARLDAALRDPDGGFLPATGTLDVARWPAHVAFERGDVRIDAGVREGDAISPYYDSMIAKLIVWGEDRAQALARLDAALRDPDGGFLPATGTLDVARWPAHVAFERGDVRIDAGVREGDAISPYYDSMIAKLIVWGADRAQALARLDGNLAQVAQCILHEQKKKQTKRSNIRSIHTNCI